MKWVFQLDCVLRVSNYYFLQRDGLIFDQRLALFLYTLGSALSYYGRLLH